MTTFLLRANHANEYELQNYYPLVNKLDLQLVTSRHPLTSTQLPTIKLWSPTDLPAFPYRRQLLNRVVGGEQWLLGLESLVTPNDILHTAETYTPYTHQAVQLRRQGLISKLICTCWETIPGSNDKFARLRQWKKDAYRFVDLFHTPTARAANALIKEGVSKNKIKVIPYGVDTKIFFPPKIKTKNKKPIILTVARRVPEKGISLWEQVKQMIGDRADFRWVDNLPYQDLPAVYRSADIFFFPSLTTPTWEEQYGMALVEAMASGLPIVASSSGAIPEVVGRAGIFFEPGSVPGAVSSLRELISKKDLSSRLSRLSLTEAKLKYNAENQAKVLSTMY